MGRHVSSGTELARAYITLLPQMPGAGKRIGAQLNGADVKSAADKSGKTIGDRMMGKVTKSLKIATVAVGALGASVLGLAVHGGIARQLQIEDATAKLDGLGHSTATVEKIMSNALAAVKGTSYGMGEAASLAAGAVAAGIEPGEELTRILKLTGDAATIAGVDLSSMGAIFNKVAANNKLSGQEVLQLQQQGFPILKMIAEQYGVTQEAASQMVSRGEIDFASFANAIEANVGGAALKSGNTTRGAYANMMAALSRVGVQLTQWFFPLVKDVFNGVTVLLDGVTAALEPWSTAFTATFADLAGPAIEGFGESVLAVMDGVLKFGPILLDAASSFSPLLIALDAVVAVLPVVGGSLLSIAEAVGGVLLTLLPVLAGAFADISVALSGALAALLPSLVVVLEALAVSLVALTPAIEVVVPLLAAMIVKAVELITPLLQIEPLVIAAAAALVIWKTGLVASTMSMATNTAAWVANTSAMLASKTQTVYLAGLYAKDFVVSSAKATAAVARSTAAWVAKTTSLLVHNPAMIASTVATTASTVATNAAAAATKVFNLVLRANPIGLVITAVTGLVAALGWFFTQTETGSKIVTFAWDAIGSAIGSVANWVTGDVVPAFSASWDAISAGAQALYDKAIRPVFEAIEAVISVTWKVIKTIFDAYVAVWTFVGKVFWNVWSLVIQVAWMALQASFRAGWAFVRDVVFTPFRVLWDFVGGAFKSVWDTLIRPTWETLQSILSAGWSFVRQFVFTPFSDVVTALGGAFTSTKAVIDTAWDGIQSAGSTAWGWMEDNVFAPLDTAVDEIGKAFESTKDVVASAWEAIATTAIKPVNFVISTVYTDGIKNLFDTVAENLGLSQRLPAISPISMATGGVLPGYTPGVDVHHFTSPTAGSLHLSGGEAIMVPEWTKAVGGPAAVAAMNARARRGASPGDEGGSSFFLGGVWDSVKSTAGAAWDFTTDAVSAIGNFMKDPVAGAVKVFTAPIEAMLSEITGGAFGQIVAGVPRTLVKGIIDGATRIFGPARDDGSDPSGAGPVATGSSPMGVAAMSAALRALIPGARITSGLRPGATVAGTNILSMHGAGRAIDIGSPTMGMFNTLLAAYPAATELLFSPAGGRQRQRGRGGSFAGDTSGVTKAMHYNHIHWAMADGGVWPGAKVYDDGGWIPPGGVAVNLSDRPEPVFSANQWDTLGEARGDVLPEVVVLRVGDREFVAYVEDIADGQIAADKRALSGHRGYGE